jgi:hypothetical protein
MLLHNSKVIQHIGVENNVVVAAAELGDVTTALALIFKEK